MTSSRWLTLLALTALVACVATERPPAPAPVPVVAEVIVPAITESSPDPRVVRCGIDDLPRRIGSTELDDPDDGPLRERSPGHERPVRGDAFLGIRIPPPVVVPDDPVTRRGPLPAVRVEQGPGEPTMQALQDREDPYKECGLLAPLDEPLVPLTFGLDLASNGAPLRVSPPASNGPATPFVRCLMERSCALTAATIPGRAKRVSLSLRPSRDDSLPTASRPGLTVTTLAPLDGWTRAQTALREAAASAVSHCGPVTGRVFLQVGLSFSVNESASAGRAASRPLGSGRTRTEVVAGPRDEKAQDCMHEALAKLQLTDIPIRGTSLHAEWLLVTWNP